MEITAQTAIQGKITIIKKDIEDLKAAISNLIIDHDKLKAQIAQYHEIIQANMDDIKRLSALMGAQSDIPDMPHIHNGEMCAIIDNIHQSNVKIHGLLENVYNATYENAKLEAKIFEKKQVIEDNQKILIAKENLLAKAKQELHTHLFHKCKQDIAIFMDKSGGTIQNVLECINGYSPREKEGTSEDFETYQDEMEYRKQISSILEPIIRNTPNVLSQARRDVKLIIKDISHLINDDIIWTTFQIDPKEGAEEGADGGAEEGADGGAEEGAEENSYDKYIELLDNQLVRASGINDIDSLNSKFADIADHKNKVWNTYCSQCDHTGEIDWNYAYDIAIKRTFNSAFMAIKTFEHLSLVSEKKADS